MGLQVEKNARAGGKRRNAGIGKRELCNAGAAISQNRTRRRDKTSPYIGVKVRGKNGNISTELRSWTAHKRVTIARFSSQEQAAVAHDLVRRLFVDEASYLQLGVGKLNFWEDRAFLNHLFKENGMEEFVRKAWDTNIMAKRFRELATKALTSVTQMNIDRGLASGLPFRYEHSRESLAAISPHVAELEVEADATQTVVSPLPNHNHTCSEEATDGKKILPEVHEPEGELSEGIVLQNCIFEDNTRLKAGNEANKSHHI